jgi:2-iminobutanoate/2-iminopropanoate deaminase
MSQESVTGNATPLCPVLAPITPKGVPKPATYSHAMLIAADAPCLSISGQIGIDAEGKLGETFEKQAEVACRNLLAILEAAEMNLADLAKMTVYLTRAENIGAWRAVRARVLGDSRPASTLLVVAALADPAWGIEIEGIAARRLSH